MTNTDSDYGNELGGYGQFSPERDAHIGEYGTYWEVPKYILDIINRYVEDDVPPGGFLTAVLSNDLVGAFTWADSDCKSALPDIVRYLNNEIPAESWGSKDKVEAWLNRKCVDSATGG